MAPGMPPPPDDSAGPQTAFGAATSLDTPVKKYGIIGRLLGQKYQDEQFRMHQKAEFLQREIHDALTNPNNRMPDDMFEERVADFAKMVGGTPDHAKEIKQTILTHKGQINASRQLAQFHNDTSAKPQQAPPVMPTAAPAAPQQDDSAGPRVGGLPPIPFGSGAPSSAPIPNEPAPVKASADLSRTGDGIPAPAPVVPIAPPTPVVAQVTSGSRNRISRAQLGVEQAAQARPALEMQGEVGREQAVKDFEAKKARYESEPWFKGLTDRQKAEALSGVNISAEPHFSIPGVTISQAGDMDANGKSVEAGVPGRRTLMNGAWIFTAEPGKWTPKDVVQPDGTTKRVFYNPYTKETVDGGASLTSSPSLELKTITKPDGTTAITGVNRVTGQQGADPDPKLAGVNPAMLPSQGSATHFVQVKQPDGSTALVPTTTDTTTQKVAPGLPRPPGAPGPGASKIGKPVIVGGQSLTPGQRITFEQKASALDNTVDLAKSVKAKLPMLGSLLDAKKIELQIDPQQGIIKAFINRSVPMSDAETKLAGDFASLMEHINTLRGPLGATGFRGAEAWAALQAQRGQLTANPKVTAVVLDNTLKALMGQRDALRKGLAGRGDMPKWANEMAAPPANLPAPPDGNVPSLSDIFGKKK